MPKFIKNTLSVRLSMMVTISMGVLLMASLFIMLYYSRRAVKEEALQKAAQTLDGTVLCIDNILLSVEQATGNIYYNMLPHLCQPDMMYTYSRKIVESNPYVLGCAIVFEPYYYPDHELFMAYFHRKMSDPQTSASSPIVQSETFANKPYTQQVWYTRPMETGHPCWLNPLLDLDVDIAPITTFCLPVPGPEGKPVGVIAVDVSLSLLSKIVLEAKPSLNSYSILLDSDGNFLVHPDSTMFHKSVFTAFEKYGDPSLKVAAEATISHETGYKLFRLNSADYYVFYTPFTRAKIPGRVNEDLGWTAGIIYPAMDISGDYKRLFYYVLLIAASGLLLFFALCRIIFHRQLKPLTILTESAQRIAHGDYNAPIPDSQKHDEIGILQDNFQQMQQSLATHVNELEQLTTNLQERGEMLSATYEKVKKADQTKTTFLHNVTDQMLGPANCIDTDVTAIITESHSMDKKEAQRLSDDIQKQGKTIAGLLNDLLRRIES